MTVTAGSGDHELLRRLALAHLEGPTPWYANGHGALRFLGIDVRFEIEVGGRSADEAPPRENVLDLVDDRAAGCRGLARDRAGGDARCCADDAEAANEGEVWARPDAELEAIQDVAPLDRELDHYGAYAIAGPSTLTLGGGSIEGAAGLDWEECIDWFAPGAVRRHDRARRSSPAPSYEAMTAGVRFGGRRLALPGKGDARA